jgi:thymidine kinase
MNSTNVNNMTKLNDFGYLELIIGPMYSGKTSKLLEIYKQCKFCDIPVAVINHSFDNRYHDTMLSSHDKIMIPCVQTSQLKDIWYLENCKTCKTNDLHKSNVILINEGQFFDDLFEVVIDMLKNNKTVYVCGLDGDFERKKFGQIIDLIPYCDKVNKITSLCSICKNGKFAIFSLRITNEKEQTLIGSENYVPVCRECYEKNISVNK